MFRPLLIATLLLVTRTSAQVASDPGEPMVPPGIPGVERVDLSGDGIADVLITGNTEWITTADGHAAGWYRRYVELLPGTSVLLRSTRNNAGIYRMAEGEQLDTAALARGFHFKQLTWSPPMEPVRFQLLQQSFGLGDPPGWYGTGEYYDEPMILRSTVGGRTVIAAFTVWFTLPAGHIRATSLEVLPVPADFRKEGDPPPPVPKVEDPFSFGHGSEPQVIIPPGLPPDEAVDLNQDDVPDVLITALEEHWHGKGRNGYYVRGIAPLPGTAFLKQRHADGGWVFFDLKTGSQLMPEQLTEGLQNGTLLWIEINDTSVFYATLRHPFGMMNVPEEWTYAGPLPGTLVYRTTSYDRPLIGAFEISARVPGGELSVTPQNFVEEGNVLEVR